MDEIFANAQVLDVRIKNKVDSFANWNASDIILGDGEIAIARIQVGDGQLTPPAVAIKVGNGVDLFKDLKWIQASAGDVHGWAKKAQLEYADFSQALKDSLKEDLTSDTNTTYSFTYENDQLVVVAHNVGSDDVEVARLTIDVSTKINKVANATAGNIAALTADGQLTDSGEKIGDYAKVSYVDGTFETKANAQAEIARVEGLLTPINTEISNAKTAIGELQAADVTLQANIDGKVAKLAGAVVGNLVEFAAGGEVADTGVAVESLAVKTEVAATYETIENVSSKVSGLKTELEGKLTEVSGKVANNESAIGELQAADVTLQQNIDAKVAKVTGAVDNVVLFAADGAIKDSDVAISALAKAAEVEATYATKDALTGAIEGVNGTITGIDTRVGNAEDAIEDLQGEIETLKGTGEGSVKATVDAAINKFATDITDNEVVDSFKELVDWVAEHGPEAAEMAGNISSLDGRVTTLEADAHKHDNKAVLDGISADQVTAWDAAVQSISGVEATKTGTNVEVTAVSTDLLKNGSKTLVFNCGTASLVK